MMGLPSLHTLDQAQAVRIQRLRVPNITVTPSRGRNHNWVPRTHFLDLLKGSAVLQNA